jgi:hypothetical protein
MSENKKRLQTYVTYKLEAIVKDISVSASYIPALQSMITRKIMSSDRIDDIGNIFQKFEKMVKDSQDGVSEEEANLSFDQWEADLYVLFSLVQMLKFKAKEQNLEIKTETTATKAEFEELAREAFKGNDIEEKLKDLESKLKIVK